MESDPFSQMSVVAPGGHVISIYVGNHKGRWAAVGGDTRIRHDSLFLVSAWLTCSVARLPSWSRVDRVSVRRLMVPICGQDFASDAVAVLDTIWDGRMPISPAYPWGGMIAQHVAIHAPERVSSLSLVCTYARPGPWGDLAWKVRLQLMDDSDPNAQRHAAIMLLTSPQAIEAEPGIIDLLMALWADAPNDPASYLAQMHFLCGLMMHTTPWRHYDVPALVVSAVSSTSCARPERVRNFQTF